MLKDIKESYENLKELQDKPGDLEQITKDLAKINGMIKVILLKVESVKITVTDFKYLKTKLQHYAEDYAFEQEIERMGPLYSNDPSRIKNMRMKILEALEDRKMMDDLGELIEKL